MKKIIGLITTILFLNGVTAQIQQKSITINEQGVFAVGGTIVQTKGEYNPINPETDGQTLHVDHATIQYQIPNNARKLPLVFWHGYGQTSRSWQTTADGREGFQTLFLKENFPVYLIDQPRRGQGGRSSEVTTISATPDEQFWLGMFRIAKGNEFMPNVQFDKSPETLNQFFRQISPDLGKIDFEVNTNAVSALFDKIGDGILITHSHSGGQGWTTAMKNDKIKAIVSYEPGSGFVFPEGEVPSPMESTGGILKAVGVSKVDFLKLTKIPIIMYYGDFIPETPSEFYGTDNWRTRLEMAKLFVGTINKYGGDAKVVHLPEIGIKGNTHFPMSDLNNKEIAKLMSNWLAEKGLDEISNLNLSTSEEIKTLSKIKWQWMADKNVDSLSSLFHKKAKFVHMGGTWGTEQELAIIGSGGIHYKKADVHDVSIEIFDNTAIVWNRITLLAVVGGNEVTNPFMVTEVYQKENHDWKLTNLTFSKLLQR
ncbi:DUF4440 domain-containing protein [Urechidicola croceus]|uniref:DUF4440 domain-containing protein n=1 Tax=Urechidicola croceus TaxID=1850246 RepID=UPI000AB9159D|nr:DUF4440 domain-containing protein [Urechidicola croceus]